MTDQNPKTEPLQAPPCDDLESAHTIAPPEIEVVDDLPDDPEIPDNVTPPSPQEAARNRKYPSRTFTKLLSMIARGLGSKTIAKALGIPLGTAKKRVKELKPILFGLRNEAPWYQGIRGDVLNAAEFRAVKSMMDPRKHAKAGLKDAAYAFKAIHAANRLERNLTTANTASVSLNPIDVTHLRKAK